MMKKGFFVSLEGIDGAGKHALAQALQAHLQNQGVAALLTEEPTNSLIGVLIREILDGKRLAPHPNLEFQRLFVKDRLEHIRSLIRPHLEAGGWLISSRYWLSTLAYGMLDESVESYLELHREVIGNAMVYPDLTLILDLPAEEGLLRIRAAGRHFDWFTKQEKLEKIRESYLELAKRDDLGKIMVLDATQPKDRMFHEACAAIDRYIPRR